MLELFENPYVWAWTIVGILVGMSMEWMRIIEHDEDPGPFYGMAAFAWWQLHIMCWPVPLLLALPAFLISTLEYPDPDWTGCFDFDRPCGGRFLCVPSTNRTISARLRAIQRESAH